MNLLSVPEGKGTVSGIYFVPVCHIVAHHIVTHILAHVNKYRRVTGSNNVEVLTFSGF